MDERAEKMVDFPDEGINQKPAVVPELAEWQGAEGCLSVGTETAIVLDEAAEQQMRAAAEELQKDYKEETGVLLEIRTGTPGDGDFYFTAEEADSLGEEGYRIEIGERISIKAEHEKGAYWATRTILQILKLNKNTMPKGLIRDYPKYKVRGFHLDVARKPVSLGTLYAIAKEMAYYKMNDFQVHLNDNFIFLWDYENEETAMEQAYTGFRLESAVKKGDILEGDSKGVPNAADLSSKDLAYSKKAFREFILQCRRWGVAVVPELDAPGHCGAFLKVRPDLHLKKILEGNPSQAIEQFDLSGECYADSLNFVKKVWDEYLNEDMFDKDMVVHIGTDEYYGPSDEFRRFSDDMIEHVQKKNRIVRMWGSLSHKKGDYPVRAKNVQMNCWCNRFADPKEMYEAGYGLINSLDEDLYMVPSAGHYADYLNTEYLYNEWKPNVIGGVEIPEDSAQMLGSNYCIWNDSIDLYANGITEVDIYDRFYKALPTLAQRNWRDKTAVSYEEMQKTVEELGVFTKENPYERAEAKDGVYAAYKLTGADWKQDVSENGRNLEDGQDAEQTEAGLLLAGGESYVSTPLNKAAVGSTLEVTMTLQKEPEAGEILFEADVPQESAATHDIRIFENGKLGFTREFYEYIFDYSLPVGTEVTWKIVTEGTKTTLYADGREYEAVGRYVDPQGRRKREGIRAGAEQPGGTGVATFQIPAKRIGSRTKAVHAVMKHIEVYQNK